MSQHTPNDPLPAEPFTLSELAHHRDLAERGENPPLSIVRRYIATIRKSILSNPISVEKTKKSRVIKPKPDESQIDFF